MTVTFDKKKQRMLRTAHFLMWNYLEVGDTLHAEGTAKRLQGIIRTWGSQRCQRRNKPLKVKAK